MLLTYTKLAQLDFKDNDEREDLLIHITHSIESRHTWRTKGLTNLNIQNDIFTFKLPYIHQTLKKFSFYTFLNDKRFTRHLPLNHNIPMPKINSYYAQPTHLTLCNYPQLRYISKEQFNTITNTNCICETHTPNYLLPYIDKHHKHIYTTDTDMIQNTTLKKLFNKNRNYRPKFPSHDNFLTELNEQLQNFTLQLKKHNTITHTLELKKWTDEILQYFTEYITWINTTDTNTTNNNSHPLNLTTNDTKYLKHLHSHYFIGYQDKISNNYAFMCKKYTLLNLYKEINTPTYQIDNITIDERNNKLQQILNNLNIPNTHKNKVLTPYLYPSLKTHKNPSSCRFVTGSVNAPLAHLAKSLNAVLRLLEPDTHLLWQHSLNKIPIDKQHLRTMKPWMTNNSKSLPQQIQKLNREIPPELINKNIKIQVLDFTTLYTKLPQENICKQLNKLILDIFIYKQSSLPTTIRKNTHKNKPNNKLPNKEIFIKVNTTNYKASWYRADSRPNNTNTITYITAEIILLWISTIIHNTYVYFAGSYHKQNIGIPMGTNPAVYIANFHLFTYELAFIEKCIYQKLWIVLEYIRYTNRFLDDLINLLNPDFNEITKYIYPQELELSIEHTEIPAHWLDVNISYNYEN